MAENNNVKKHTLKVQEMTLTDAQFFFKIFVRSVFQESQVLLGISREQALQHWK